jgi:hypothetical protein
MYFEHPVLFLRMFLTIIKVIDMPEMHAKDAAAATNWKVEWNGIEAYCEGYQPIGGVANAMPCCRSGQNRTITLLKRG